jgi:hypothetical protein
MSKPRYTINNFYDTLTNHGVRTKHQFQVELTSRPEFEDLELYFQTADLPGRTIENAEVKFYGFNFNVPTNLKYDNTWTVTVICDTDLKIREKFETWMDEIASLARNTGGMKGRISKGFSRLHLLDSNLTDITKSYVMVGMYPEKLGKITNSHTDSGVATFDVTLKFQYWYDQDKGNPL